LDQAQFAKFRRYYPRFGAQFCRVIGLMCTGFSMLAAVRIVPAFLILASGVREVVEFDSHKQDKSECGYPNCGQADEYCCQDNDDGSTLLSKVACEELAMSHVGGCKPCDDGACGFCKGPVGDSDVWCGPEGSVCCSEFQGNVMGHVLPGERCSEMGLVSVDGCEQHEQGEEENLSTLYVTHPVLDGGNCMFDALVRGLESSLFDNPVDCMEVALKAQKLRIQAANLLLDDDTYRRDFLQSLKAVHDWEHTMKAWLLSRNVTDRQSFTDHNDEEFKAWIQNIWANPPILNGKLQGGVELYGDRLILKILGNALGTKVQVLDTNFKCDETSVGDAESDTTIYVRHSGQHYEAVREKVVADQLVAKMQHMISVLQAETAIETTKVMLGGSEVDVELSILLSSACNYLFQNELIQATEDFTEDLCWE